MTRLTQTAPRTTGGYPRISHHGKPVVAADAVALLSRCNYGSVEKVLVALAVLQDYTGLSLASLVKLSDIPLERVHPERTTDKERAVNSVCLVRDIAQERYPHDIEYLLYLRKQRERGYATEA